MTPLPLLLLPGLHGTSQLFERLIALAPEDVQPIAVTLPEKSSYAELHEALRGQLPTGRFAIAAESFSGPLAVALAREAGDRVVALILSNSFVSPPRTPLLRFLPWSLMFRIPAPGWAIRFLVIGWRSPATLVNSVRTAIRTQPPSILGARMRAIFNLPRSFQGNPVGAPLLILQGSEDVLVPPQARELNKVAVHAVRVDIRAPHLLLQTAPEEAWSAIRGLARGDSRPSSLRWT